MLQDIDWGQLKSDVMTYNMKKHKSSLNNPVKAVNERIFNNATVAIQAHQAYEMLLIYENDLVRYNVMTSLVSCNLVKIMKMSFWS